MLFPSSSRVSAVQYGNLLRRDALSIMLKPALTLAGRRGLHAAAVVLPSFRSKHPR